MHNVYTHNHARMTQFSRLARVEGNRRVAASEDRLAGVALWRVKRAGERNLLPSLSSREIINAESNN